MILHMTIAGNPDVLLTTFENALRLMRHAGMACSRVDAIRHIWACIPAAGLGL